MRNAFGIVISLAALSGCSGFVTKSDLAPLQNAKGETVVYLDEVKPSTFVKNGPTNVTLGIPVLSPVIGVSTAIATGVVGQAVSNASSSPTTVHFSLYRLKRGDKGEDLSRWIASTWNYEINPGEFKTGTWVKLKGYQKVRTDERYDYVDMALIENCEIQSECLPVGY